MDYRRRLPHLYPEGAWLFVTWRLAGSLPARPDIIAPRAPQGTTAGAAFVARDRQADLNRSGPQWLADRRVAQIITSTLFAGERQRGFYCLRAWVIMPNHVHVLWTPRVEAPMITRWVKGSTARRANVLLGRTGQVFWQDESYDHWVRNRDEVEKIVRYIERNPVQAGLAKVPEDWPWSSAARETVCPTV
jgi:REP element-mobilizing transposase RayT